MNKIISNKEGFFISLVVPSASEKFHPIFDWLKTGTFSPGFDKKKVYIYQHYQPFYIRIQRENHKIIQGEAFDLVENLSDNKKKHLLVFVDSCEKNSYSQQFLKIATAGRHRV